MSEEKEDKTTKQDKHEESIKRKEEKCKSKGNDTKQKERNKET